MRHCKRYLQQPARASVAEADLDCLASPAEKFPTTPQSNAWIFMATQYTNTAFAREETAGNNA